MTCRFLVALPFILILSSCSDEPEASDPRTATSTFYGISASSNSLYETDSTVTYGYATLTQRDSSVLMTITLTGLPPNSIHAVHIHTGDCVDPGQHWNMGLDMSVTFCETLSMGVPWGRPMAGDIGNIIIGAENTGTLILESTFWELGTGSEKDIADRVIVIHDKPEDFTSECMPDHGNHPHFNSKIGCGSIALTPELLQ